MSNLDQTDTITIRIQPQIKNKMEKILLRNRDLYTNVSGFVRASIILNITIVRLGLQKEVFKLIREKRGRR